jgi:microcin C transport system permease protein
MENMSTAVLPQQSLSPSRRACLRFKRNRLGYWSLVFFCALVLVSLCAELVSNDRPLIVRYEGQTYFPMFKDYPEKTFGGDFETATDYLDPFIKQKLSEGSNWALYTLNPYGPNTLNYFANAPNPSAPTVRSQTSNGAQLSCCQPFWGSVTTG